MRHRFLVLSAFLVSNTLLSACSSNTDGHQDTQDSGTAPIPRFPPGGVPGAADQSTQASGSQGTSQTEPGPAPGDQSSSTGSEASQENLPTGSPTTSSTASQSSTSSSTSASTSQSTSSLSTSSQSTSSPTSSSQATSSQTQPEAKPTQAPFVDWGGFRVAMEDDGEIIQSAKSITPDDEHQITRLGHERISSPGLGTGVIIRRTYGIFDVSQIQDAVSAKIEYYVFASSAASAGAGGYTSPDPSETVEIHALDQFTPQELLDAPFGDESNHSLDPKIAQDLADGPLYGSFELSPQFLAVDKLSPGPTATPERSDCSDKKSRACGRWLTIPLTPKAVQDINASQGLWGMGWNLVSIDHAKATRRVKEFLFFGPHMDTSPRKTRLLPDYVKPKPRLVLSY